MHNECETVERQAANDSSWDHPITQLSYHWYSILRICYPCLFFISVVLLNISGHSKVCHFTRFSSTSQYIWSCQVSEDNLLQTEDYSKYLKPSWTLQSHKKKTSEVWPDDLPSSTGTGSRKIQHAKISLWNSFDET